MYSCTSYQNYTLVALQASMLRGGDMDVSSVFRQTGRRPLTIGKRFEAASDPIFSGLTRYGDAEATGESVSNRQPDPQAGKAARPAVADDTRQVLQRKRIPC